jgi:MFS family permease
MARLRSALAPFTVRSFRWLWLGQGISSLGDRCYEIALVWQLVALTGSTVIVGTVLTVAYIPTIALLALGGVVADRFSRRGIVIWSDLLRAVVTLIFALLASLSRITLPQVFALVVVYGIVAAFFNPAMAALLPALVKPDRYAQANSLRQIATNLSILIGPALGGYLVAQYSIPAALTFDAATFLVALFASLRMGRVSPEAEPNQPAKPQRIGSPLAGVSFLWGEPGLLIMMLLFSIINGLNNVEALLVPFVVQRELQLPASAYGLMATCFGLGAIGGALVIGPLEPRLRRRAPVMCMALALFGGAIAALGLAHTVVVFYVAYVGVGVGFMAPEILLSTLLQRIVPADRRGRVFSVISAVAMAMNPLGLLLAGALGQSFGPRGGLLIGGGAIVALAVLMFLVPAVRRLDRRAGLAGASVREPAREGAAPPEG